MSNLIRSRKTRVSAILASAAVSLGMVAGPAAAQNTQNGLVNVVALNGTDIAVGVTIPVAANVCGVSVNALAADFQQDGRTNCDSQSNGELTITQNRGNPNG